MAEAYEAKTTSTKAMLPLLKNCVLLIKLWIHPLLLQRTSTLRDNVTLIQVHQPEIVTLVTFSSERVIRKRDYRK